MDCIGLIELQSLATDIVFVLLVCTQWPTVFVLETFAAKIVYNALLEMFLNMEYHQSLLVTKAI